jgi:ADP-ribose pyrophosphatase
MSTSDVGPAGWRVRLAERVLENPWFSVLQQRVAVPDGTERTYWTLDFPSPAVAVMVGRGDDFLLMRQYRFIVGEHVWAIPSGGVEAGESLTDAAGVRWWRRLATWLRV